MNKLDKEKFICIDCETTGLDSQNDSVIEVAVVLFTFDEVLEEFESLIDPEKEIPEASIAIHHISNEMVAGKPKIAEILPVILKLIGNKTIVGHGIKFDIDILAAAAAKTGIPCTITNNETIDTLRLARLYGDSPTNALATLGLHFNVDSDGAHRAMSDVKVNIEVFKHLAGKYRTVADIHKTLLKPILMKSMPLGPYKGRSFREIPLPYLKWAAHKDFDRDLIHSIKTEIHRRKQGNTFLQSGNPFHNLDL